MKNTTTIIALSTILYTFIFITEGFAQQNQLKQDIRIGESILSEMISDNSDQFPFWRDQSGLVNGEYLDGYGVHFSIGLPIGKAITRHYRNKEESITLEEQKERIESIIRDYLQNYAVLIRNLSENEHVRLTYGIQNRVHRIMIYQPTVLNREKDSLRISAWASVSDLKSHRNGEISDYELQNRIQIDDLSELKPSDDLRIFASILKTSLDNAETTHLHSGREPVLDYIPGLGIQYRIDISARSKFSIAGLQGFAGAIDDHIQSEISNIEIDLGKFMFDDGSRSVRVGAPSFEFKSDSISISFTELDDSLMYNVDKLQKQINKMRDRFEELRTHGVEIPGRIQYQQSDRDTVDYSEDYEKIKRQVYRVLADYGQTLSSLSDSEFITISINWRGRELPDRTTFRITKEDLFSGKEPVVNDYN